MSEDRFIELFREIAGCSEPQARCAFMLLGDLRGLEAAALIAGAMKRSEVFERQKFSAGAGVASGQAFAQHASTP